MTSHREGRVEPDSAASDACDELCREYTALHDYVGRGGNDVMKRPGRISRAAQTGAARKEPVFAPVAA
jgi:L-ribulokinase